MMKLLLLLSMLLLTSLVTASNNQHHHSSTTLLWTDAFDALAATFKDEPFYRSLLVGMMSKTSVKDINYPQNLCNHPEFIKCIADPQVQQHSSADGVEKGTATSPAWQMILTISNKHIINNMKKKNDEEKHLAFSSISWSDLPKNVNRVNIDFSSPGKKNKNNRQKILLSEIKSNLPSYFDGTTSSLEIYIKNGILDTSSSSEKSSSSGSSSGFFSKIILENCEIPKTFTTSPPVLLNVFDKTKIITIRNSIFEAADGADAQKSFSSNCLGMIHELEELNLIDNKGIDDAVQIVEKLVQREENVGKNENAAKKGLKHLRIELLEQQDTSSSSAGTKLYEDLEKLSDLISIRIGNVGLTEIPTKLPENLKSLGIIFGKISGEFPNLSQHFSSSKLEAVDFSGNSISTFPTTEKNEIPKNIESITLTHSPSSLKGANTNFDLQKIPHHLKIVNVSHNKLAGSLDLTDLPDQLEVLDLSFNEFSGKINLRKLPGGLKEIYVNDNQLTGRYDVTNVPLLSKVIAVGNNNWDSLMPPRRGRKSKNK